MIRTGHFYHDLREVLGSARLLLGLLAVAVFLIMYVSPQFIYISALVFGVIIGGRGLIGRRCPRCDAPLKEIGAEQDKENAMILYVNWKCPNDDYTEKEKTKGDAGLFGVN